jgi:hypothetical protein
MNPSRARVLAVLVPALALGLAAALLSRTASGAEPAATHTLYVSVTGDGPNAKAWYAGGSPVGVSVQDALTTLAGQGYRVKALVAGERSVVVSQAAAPTSLAPERAYVLLLER